MECDILIIPKLPNDLGTCDSYGSVDTPPLRPDGPGVEAPASQGAWCPQCSQPSTGLSAGQLLLCFGFSRLVLMAWMLLNQMQLTPPTSSPSVSVQESTRNNLR